MPEIFKLRWSDNKSSALTGHTQWPYTISYLVPDDMVGPMVKSLRYCYTNKLLDAQYTALLRSINYEVIGAQCTFRKVPVKRSTKGSTDVDYIVQSRDSTGTALEPHSLLQGELAALPVTAEGWTLLSPTSIFTAEDVSKIKAKEVKGREVIINAYLKQLEHSHINEDAEWLETTQLHTPSETFTMCDVCVNAMGHFGGDCTPHTVACRSSMKLLVPEDKHYSDLTNSLSALKTEKETEYAEDN